LDNYTLNEEVGRFVQYCPLVFAQMFYIFVE
jgi:hypothetical protein